MIITPAFLDQLRDKIPLSTLIGRKVKLTRRGHEYTGLCPFHHEKTASFTINDDKGFYHCFGCGAHGDIVRYLTESEKMPFMEAVEFLANMAGLPMPKPTKEERQAEEMKTNLTAIMEEACRFFQAQLFGMGGERAKNYLIKRGISGVIAKQFRLGYAPSGSALTQHLQAKGFSQKECIRLGLLAQNHESNRVHDYFYDRVMFPILDRRKRVIGFGGRMMEKGEPKYLNSPETTLFHKGEQLYALPNAIETIRKKNEAILVEGYMDVIALHSSGFTNAVAPLGTALTENQIKILWQSCDEPLICFDGDSAGQKASIRALYRALPILTPGKSLRFVQLPNPYDPDDMIRKKSPEAFSQVLKEAIGLSDMLWNYLLSTHSLDTPEKKALFEKETIETIEKIQDSTVKGYYQNDFKNRIWKLTHTTKRNHQKRILKTTVHTPIPGSQDARMIIAYLLLYPNIVSTFLDDIISIRFPDRVLNELLQKITSSLLDQPDLTTADLNEIAGKETLDMLAAEIEMIQKSKRTEEDIPSILKQIIIESKRQNIQAEIDQQTNLYFQNPTEEIWNNIKILKQEIENLKNVS